jgi:hypothetical protein
VDENKHLKILDRVEKLVALAGSSSIEEARTAAYQACKLIRENKLSIKEPKDDHEAAWIRDMQNKHDPNAPLVHFSTNSHSALCGTRLTNGVNYYLTDHVTTLRNACHDCVRVIVGMKERGRR